MNVYPEFDGPTIPASRLPPDCPLPVQLTVSLASAEAAVDRALLLGLVICAMAFTVGFMLGTLV